MHRLPSAHSIIRFRLASVLLVILALLAPPTIGILAYAFFFIDREMFFIALCLIGVAVLAALLQWGLTSRARCPLCHIRALAGNRCSKHRAARTLMGSHRLRVACDVVFRKSFRCPYCGENVALRKRSMPQPLRKFSK
jgi:hypothetical protein